MKNKYWIALLGGIVALCLGLSVFLLQPQQAHSAQIFSDGKLIATVSLLQDQVIPVQSAYGTNIVTVKDGAIAVTAASCPDHYCMDRGFCSGGVQIVCLPNRLVIRFLGQQDVDGAVG